MKKLMIAAAAVAIIASAQAETICTDAKVTFDENQIVVLKYNSSKTKLVDLTAGKTFAKTTYDKYNAIDGVLYYEPLDYNDDDVCTNGLFKAFTWSKDMSSCLTNDAAIAFVGQFFGGEVITQRDELGFPTNEIYTFTYPVYVNATNTAEKSTAMSKAVAVVRQYGSDTAMAYAPISVKRAKITVGSKSVSGTVLDDEIKSIKVTATSAYKATVRTFKDKAARDKALESYEKKFENALKKAK